MKRYIIQFIIVIVLGTTITSCLKDLDITPNDPTVITSSSVFDDTAAYKQCLARIYGSLTLTGLGTNATDPGVGDPDIIADDEGKVSYLRLYWCAQELTTDEAVNGWGDQDIKELHNQNWSSSNTFLGYMFTRIYYNVALCNEYIRTVNGKVNGLDATLKADVTKYLAEVRLLRALSYYHALDMYKDVPFVTENDKVGAFFPNPISRVDLFTYLETELKAISPILAAPKTNEYGRADRVSAWMILAKMYLNANIYINQEKNTDCITYCDSIIKSGYTIHPNFQELFLADNDKTCTDEIILPIVHDGIHTKTYGGMTFIIQAAVGGSKMTKAEFGVGGWGGNRTTSAAVKKFTDLAVTDSRQLFFTNGQSLEITNIGSFTDGYAVSKFKNVTSTGTAGSDGTFVDTDYPLFRLADAYLMYAEALLRRNSSGDKAQALTYVNTIRERACGVAGDISINDINVDFILDERGRELLWEGTRRTDLIRFGKFTTGGYLWPWKGGSANGISTNDKYNIFPIPAADLAANPKLTPTY